MCGSRAVSQVGSDVAKALHNAFHMLSFLPAARLRAFVYIAWQPPPDLKTRLLRLHVNTC